nr:transposase [Streptomyces tendae]
MRTPAAGTDPRSPDRPGPATLQARPGHRRQGLQLPRLPRLPATTRHCARHPEKADQRRHRHKRGRCGGRPPGFDRETYRRRNVIERCFNRLKGFRGIATRYDKTATSYEAAVTLTSFLLWARSV